MLGGAAQSGRENCSSAPKFVRLRPLPAVPAGQLAYRQQRQKVGQHIGKALGTPRQIAPTQLRKFAATNAPTPAMKAGANGVQLFPLMMRGSPGRHPDPPSRRALCWSKPSPILGRPQASHAGRAQVILSNCQRHLQSSSKMRSKRKTKKHLWRFWRFQQNPRVDVESDRTILCLSILKLRPV